MNKILKWILLSLAALLLILFGVFKILQWHTKLASPEDTVTWSRDGLELEVFYNRPYKKNRVIFGGLVPYDKVWRTGANEATTFKTNKNLLIDGQPLKKGKYTLWTIPGKDYWVVIFNNKMYSWGVDLHSMPSRNPEYDVVRAQIPVTPLRNTIEQFTIAFREKGDTTALLLIWDKTLIEVPLKGSN